MGLRDVPKNAVGVAGGGGFGRALTHLIEHALIHDFAHQHVGIAREPDQILAVRRVAGKHDGTVLGVKAQRQRAMRHAAVARPGLVRIFDGGHGDPVILEDLHR